MPNEGLDILIVGGGPAGMSALAWSHSLALDAQLVERSTQLGGQMRQMYHRVTDYLGRISTDGAELSETFEQHLKTLQLRYLINRAVTEVDLRSVRVCVDSQWLTPRYVVLATGARKRTLGIPGEARLAGSGVSSSATRDHPAFAGREVVVVGGGDSAFENSLILARVCSKVTLVHRSASFRARPQWIREASEHPRISIITDKELVSIEGDKHVEGVVIRSTQGDRLETIPVEGVFIRLGMTPNSELFKGQVDVDEAGYIFVDRQQQTSVPNVYAVGDITHPVSMSIASAVGQAATAVKAIARRKSAECFGWSSEMG